MGSQSFRQLLVFEHKAALHRFTAGQFGFAAGASAAVLKSGVATPPGGDIVYDGPGSGGCFAHNLFGTAFLPGTLGCGQGPAETNNRGR